MSFKLSYQTLTVFKTDITKRLKGDDKENQGIEWHNKKAIISSLEGDINDKEEDKNFSEG